MDITPTIVCQDMMSLLSRFKQEMMRIAEERDLTMVQIAALHQIDQHGELPMGKVAHVLHCDPSNVTGIIDRLVTHKLVDRQECPTDRRAKTITLTEKGKTVVKEITAAMPGRLGCDKLSGAEMQAIHAAVQKIT